MVTSIWVYRVETQQGAINTRTQISGLCLRQQKPKAFGEQTMSNPQARNQLTSTVVWYGPGPTDYEMTDLQPTDS